MNLTVFLEFPYVFTRNLGFPREFTGKSSPAGVNPEFPREFTGSLQFPHVFTRIEPRRNAAPLVGGALVRDFQVLEHAPERFPEAPI